MALGAFIVNAVLFAAEDNKTIIAVSNLMVW